MSYKKKLFEENKEIIDILNGVKNPDTQIFLVGGYIRDLILEKFCTDRDFVVLGENAVNFAKKVAEKVDGYFVLLDDKNDIARVVMPDKINYLDFAACVGSSIEEDLARRDFTINSIACSFSDNEAQIIDIFDGIDGIKNKIIKTCNINNLKDDPLRILRAFRFAAGLDFKIDDKIHAFIKENKELLNKPAKERVNVELVKLFEGKYCSKILAQMKNNGLLYLILPELEKQEKVPPNLHHHLKLIDHSIETVRQIELLENTLPDWVQEELNSEFVNGIKKIALLKFSALIHDIGKPQTWIIEEDGRHRFIKHEEIGVEIATPILKKLKFSNNAIKYITKLIKHHIYPSQLIRPDDEVSQKAIMRMFRRLEDDTPDVIVIAMADRLSAKGSEITDQIVQANLDGLIELLEKYKTAKETIKNLPKLISGNDVMEILQIQPSPTIGVILKQIEEAQLAGEITTVEQAKEFVEKHTEKTK
ncbi:MAG: HD domain-containing protein [Candidatus Gastranaerophilales bacterium]|nr:HD domain-containing protein [Candidatus Gastranaerophilales bacterium]